MAEYHDKNEIFSLFGKHLPDFGEVGRISSASQLKVCVARGLRRVLIDAPTVLRDERICAAAEEKHCRPMIDTRLSVMRDLLFERKDQPRAKEMLCSVQNAYFEREVYIVPENLVSVTAYATHEGVVDLTTAQDLRGLLNGSFLRFHPSRMNTVIVSVYTRELDEPDLTSPVTFENERSILRGVFPEAGGEWEVLTDARNPYDTRMLYAENLGKRFLDEYGYDIVRYLGALFVKSYGGEDSYIIDYYTMLGKILDEAYYMPKRNWLSHRTVRTTLCSVSENPLIDRISSRMNKSTYMAKDMATLPAKAHRDKAYELALDRYTPIVDIPNAMGPEDAAFAEITQAVRRLAFIAALGKNPTRCHVLYPSDSLFCREPEAVESLARCHTALLNSGTEFRYIDKTEVKPLIAKPQGRAVIVPHCPILDENTLADLVRFVREGGTVLFFEAEPEYGKDARAFLATRQELLSDKYAFDGLSGVMICRTEKALTDTVTALIPPIVKDLPAGRLVHRSGCDCDWFIAFHTPQHARLNLAARGSAETWSINRGRQHRFYGRREKDGRTEIIVPYSYDGVRVFCFNPEEKAVTVATRGLCRVLRADENGNSVVASTAMPGEKQAFVYLPHRTAVLNASVPEIPDDILLNGTWRFRTDMAGEPTVYVDTLFRPDGSAVVVGHGTDMMLVETFCEDTSELEHDIARIGYVRGDVLTLKEEKLTWKPYSLGPTGHIVLGEGRHYLATTVKAEEEEEVTLSASTPPTRLYCNGAFYPAGRRIYLKKGINTFLLRYDGAVNTDFALESKLRYADETAATMAKYEFSVEEPASERFRFPLPYFAKKLHICSFAAPETFCDGRECLVLGGKKTEKNGMEYTVRVDPEAGGHEVEIRFEKQEILNGGAILPCPIEVICGSGDVDIDDTNVVASLGNYRGNLHYTKQFELGVLDNRYELELGNYCGTVVAEVNGATAGVLFGGERVDITGMLHSGNNTIDLHVAYDGTVSRASLDGTVRLRLSKDIVLE